MQGTVLVGGYGLYVDDRGPVDAPALLYLHGGPGQGCSVFMGCQGERLAGALRVVGLDQRGILRSDPLRPEDGLTVTDLVSDCEAVREHLGIGQWTILGHSFGGYLALIYALRHPTTVTSVVFENPFWDAVSTGRSLLLAAAALLQQTGGAGGDVADVLAAAESGDPREAWSNLALLSRLGPRRADLYLRRAADLNELDRLETEPKVPDRLERIAEYQRRLFSADGDDNALQPLLPHLSSLTQPALLITGRHDHVTGAEQVQAFDEGNPRRKVIEFVDSAHFPHLEEPDCYTRVVTEFVAAAPKL